MRCLPFVAAFTVAVATPAAATNVGLFLEGGGGYGHVSAPEAGEELDFLHPSARFGMLVEDFVPGAEEPSFLEIDLSLLPGVLLALAAPDVSNDAERIWYPAALGGQARSFAQARLMGFRSVAMIDTIAGPLMWGFTLTPFDWGASAVYARNDDGPITSEHVFGSPFVGIGAGPAVGYVEGPLKIYASAAPHGMVWVEHDYLLGYALAGDVDVFFTIIEGFLDARARLGVEYRHFRHTQTSADVPAGFATAFGTVGIVGKFGPLLDL